MRAPALGLITLIAVAACSPTEEPEERRASLQRLFDRVQAQQLRSNLTGDPRAVAKTTMERAGRRFPGAAGAALAASIRFSRSQALGAGARRMPPDLQRDLSPYFEPELLEKVRWNTAGRRLSLGTVLAGWYYREGAVTLGDTIVFSNETAAATRLLWAHELTHVEQYDELGIDGFALLYTTKSADIEERARKNARGIDRKIRTVSDDGPG